MKPSTHTKVKLHLHSPQGNVITAVGDDFVVVDGRVFNVGVLLSSDGRVEEWAPRAAADLNEEILTVLAAWGESSDCVLLGTGRRHMVLPPQWLRPFAERRLALEVMTTAAACRTYAVLLGDGRQVTAALIVGD